MLISPTKKNKINLSDYDYRRDIENRIVMSSFSIEEVDVLQEILHSSIKISIGDLTAQLHLPEEKLLPILDKLQETKLLTHDNNMIMVNKEMRKYYELQIDKFDDDFRPDIPFIKALLSKVPIHVLPSWYAIPRMSNNIIASIKEKCLATPKVYRNYLEELSFDDPVLQSIMEDVFSAPDFKIRSRTLREKYSLSREQFEEALLHLEFNFVCYLSYTRVDGMWKEMVTPFYEWYEYLVFEKESLPPSITDEKAIERRSSKDFGYIEEAEKLLKKTKKKIDAVAEKLVSLQLAEIDGDTLQVTEGGKEWLALSTPDKAAAIYRNPANTIDTDGLDPKIITDRNIRLTEKALKRIAGCNWVYFDDFIKSIIEPIGNAEGVSLRKHNRGKWQYVRPQFSSEDKELIRRIVFDKFFEVGVVATGSLDGRPCFTLTSFGKTTIGV